MVATPPAEHAAASTPQDISGLYAHFIGGRRVQLDGSPDLVRNNPAAANQVLGSLRSADVELVHTAVRTAADAWPTWRNTPAPTRGRVLLEVARLMDQHRDELARLISLEEGKPIKDARAEVQRSINITEFMSGEGRRYGGYTSASESASKFAFTTRQPLGVVACITPWNFPLAIPAWKIAPAVDRRQRGHSQARVLDARQRRSPGRVVSASRTSLTAYSTSSLPAAGQPPRCSWMPSKCAP